MPSNTAPTPDRISLKQRVLNAGVWSLAGYGVSQVIRLGSSLLLTRLLVPEMFGVMAIATMVMVGLAMFSDVGLKPSIIQSKRGSDPAFLNTAWIVQIYRGVALWFLAECAALLLFLADRIGIVPKDTVYADPTLPVVIAILSMSALIGGFQSTKAFEASRNLALDRLTKIDIIVQISGVSCMILWVSIERSIWALVAGNICATLLGTLMSHFWLPGVANRWQWDRTAFQEIIHFGKWIFFSSILGFLVNNGDRLLLGGLVNASVLGVYVIAFSIFGSVEQIVSKIIVDVTYPALSEVARERALELKPNYYRFHTIIASFAYFCSGVLMVSGQALIELLYDRRYDQGGWMLQILAVALLTLPFRVATQCFMVLGIPRLLSLVGTIRLISLFLLTPIGFHLFGLPGALWGIVLSHFSWVPTTFIFKVKYKLFDLRKELLLLLFVLVGIAAGKILNSAIATVVPG
jgi:O-antigen/teichoic acid export membrane protein